MARGFKDSPIEAHRCPRCGSYDVRWVTISTFLSEIVCRLCGRKIR